MTTIYYRGTLPDPTPRSLLVHELEERENP